MEDFDLSIIIGGGKTKSKFDWYNSWPFSSISPSKQCFRQNTFKKGLLPLFITTFCTILQNFENQPFFIHNSNVNVLNRNRILYDVLLFYT